MASLSETPHTAPKPPPQQQQPLELPTSSMFQCIMQLLHPMCVIPLREVCITTAMAFREYREATHDIWPLTVQTSSSSSSSILLLGKDGMRDDGDKEEDGGDDELVDEGEESQKHAALNCGPFLLQSTAPRSRDALIRRGVSTTSSSIPMLIEIDITDMLSRYGACMFVGKPARMYTIPCKPLPCVAHLRRKVRKGGGPLGRRRGGAGGPRGDIAQYARGGPGGSINPRGNTADQTKDTKNKSRPGHDGDEQPSTPSSPSAPLHIALMSPPVNKLIHAQTKSKLTVRIDTGTDDIFVSSQSAATSTVSATPTPPTTPTTTAASEDDESSMMMYNAIPRILSDVFLGATYIEVVYDRDKGLSPFRTTSTTKTQPWANGRFQMDNIAPIITHFGICTTALAAAFLNLSSHNNNNDDTTSVRDFTPPVSVLRSRESVVDGGEEEDEKTEAASAATAPVPVVWTIAENYLAHSFNAGSQSKTPSLQLRQPKCKITIDMSGIINVVKVRYMFMGYSDISHIKLPKMMILPTSTTHRNQKINSSSMSSKLGGNNQQEALKVVHGLPDQQSIHWPQSKIDEINRKGFELNEDCKIANFDGLEVTTLKGGRSGNNEEEDASSSPDDDVVTVIEIRDSFLRCCVYLEEVDMEPLEGTQIVGCHFMQGCRMLDEHINLSSFGRHLTSIGTHFMANCDRIEEVDLSAFVHIHAYPFKFLSACLSLTSVILPRVEARTLSPSSAGKQSSTSSSSSTITISIGSEFLSECVLLEHVDLSPWSHVGEFTKVMTPANIPISDLFAGCSALRVVEFGGNVCKKFMVGGMRSKEKYQIGQGGCNTM